MIKVIAEFFIKETELDSVLKKLKPAVAATRNELGNVSYEVFQDTDDPTHLTFVEGWQSKDVLDKHMTTPHFNQLIADVTPVQAKEPVIKIYTKLL